MSQIRSGCVLRIRIVLRAHVVKTPAIGTGASYIGLLVLMRVQVRGPTVFAAVCSDAIVHTVLSYDGHHGSRHFAIVLVLTVASTITLLGRSRYLTSATAFLMLPIELSLILKHDYSDIEHPRMLDCHPPVFGITTPIKPLGNEVHLSSDDRHRNSE